METKFLIRGQDQFGLDLTHLVHGALDILGITILQGQLEIALVMPRLALEQAVVELAELFVEMWHQRGEPLATARFDKGADDQGVDQLGRLVGTRDAAQARGVAAGGDRAQRDLAALHQAQHLLMMNQLLASQARHHVDQIDMGVVLGDQAQGGAGRLEFAIVCGVPTNRGNSRKLKSLNV